MYFPKSSKKWWSSFALFPCELTAGGYCFLKGMAPFPPKRSLPKAMLFQRCGEDLLSPVLGECHPCHQPDNPGWKSHGWSGDHFLVYGWPTFRPESKWKIRKNYRKYYRIRRKLKSWRDPFSTSMMVGRVPFCVHATRCHYNLLVIQKTVCAAVTSAMLSTELSHEGKFLSVLVEYILHLMGWNAIQLHIQWVSLYT